MLFWCFSECGIEYLPPSNFLLDVLDPPKIPTINSNHTKAFEDEEHLAVSDFILYFYC